MGVYKKGQIWYIDYTFEGRRRRKAIGTSKKLAEMAYQKLRVQIAEKKHLDVRKNQRLKFNDFAERFVEEHLKVNLPDTWWKSEKHNVRHLVQYFGDKYLHEINEKDIIAFREERVKVVSKASVNKNVALLKYMFRKASLWEVFSGRNPVQNIKGFKVDNRRTRYLEKEEIKRLLAHSEGHLRDIIELAINTGMRKSEIFNLKWRDVDLNKGIITLLKTKNNEIRYVPINTAVEEIFYRVKKFSDSPYVFTSKNGKPYADIKKSFYTALRKAEISDLRFHDLRHTFASQLMMKGADLMTVKELLGHKCIEMTLRYSHLSCDHKKRAVSLLNDLNPVTKMSLPPSSKQENDLIPDSCEAIISGS